MVTKRKAKTTTPAKRTGARSDPHKALRDHLVDLLDAGHAHMGFRDGVADWPAALRGAKPPGQPFTPWRLLEHIRISQWDIVEFTKSAKHVSPKWPSGYWPDSDAVLREALVLADHNSYHLGQLLLLKRLLGIYRESGR